jgi:hypothetical protein
MHKFEQSLKQTKFYTERGGRVDYVTPCDNASEHCFARQFLQDRAFNEVRIGES